MPVMTREAFLFCYQTELYNTFDWAKDPDRLAKFIAGVVRTLDGAKDWNHDGDCVTAAWRYIGGKGKPTLKALRALG